MPLDRPSLDEIFARMQANYQAAAPDLDPYLPRSMTFALLAAQAAAVHSLYGRLEHTVRNAFEDTAGLEELVRRGEIRGMPSRSLGVKATGFVRFSGDDATFVPDGTIVVDGNGNRYRAGPDAVIVDEVVLDVTATVVGEEQNLPLGTAVELEEPIPGIYPGTGQVTNLDYSNNGLGGGRDPESAEEFRRRLLRVIRRPAQGGTLEDWRRWGFESDSDWTRIFVTPPAAGSNVIQLWAVDDTLDLVDGSAIAPAAGVYTNAEDWIDANRRPLLADFTFQAPTLVDLDPAITLTPNTTEVQDAVKEEIIQLLIREADVGGSIPLSHFREVISRAAGETDSDLTSPVTDPVTVNAGELLVLGTPVFS